MIIKSPNTATASKAPTVLLTDSEADALGLEREQKIDFFTLRDRFRKQGDADADNSAAVLMKKIGPRREKTVARAPSTFHLPITREQDLAMRAEPVPQPFSDRVRILCNAGMAFETAQHFSLALADSPPDAFNVDRTPAEMSNAQKQAFSGLQATLCAIMMAPLGRGRDALITAVTNSNTRDSLAGYARPFTRNDAMAQKWAYDVMRTIGGGMQYSEACQVAERLIADLRTMGGYNFLEPTGITDEAAAAVNATGREVARRRRVMIDASEFGKMQRNAGRR